MTPILLTPLALAKTWAIYGQIILNTARVFLDPPRGVLFVIRTTRMIGMVRTMIIVYGFSASRCSQAHLYVISGHVSTCEKSMHTLDDFPVIFHLGDHAATTMTQ